MSATPLWLNIHRGDAPLIISMPHAGTGIPPEIEAKLVSLWRARKDTDWHVDKLYDFAPSLGATIIRTGVSRTMIDVNRDPSGKTLYPGQNTTPLCPTETFDAEPLYRDGEAPDEVEIAQRRALYFNPYHAALSNEIARLRRVHGHIVLFEAHSIRSAIPNLFEDELPHLNIGTNSGASCAHQLTTAIETECASTRFWLVTNGRFKGGYITRHYGQPQNGVHAIQLELACRTYLQEPYGPVNESNWPVPYDRDYAGPMRDLAERILKVCLEFTREAAA